MRHEKKEKEFYAGETESLKTRITELCEHYDDMIRRKDAQLMHRSERETSEVQSLKLKVVELENKIKQKESELDDLTAEKEEAKIIHENDKLALSKLENDLKVCKRVATDYEAHYNDCKNKLKAQNELISSLNAEISKLENGRFDLEERLAQKEDEYQMERANEQETIKQSVGRMKEKYKSKIQKYKAKLAEYKTKITEKDEIIYEIKKKMSQQSLAQEKNEELLRLKAEELRELYENKLYHQEDEFRAQQKELIDKNEEQLRELQIQFQRLLDSKLAACRQDAQGQIDSLRRTEREFQTMPESRVHFSEREYIKITIHEERLREKQTLIDKLKTEIKLREVELREEMASKLKQQEEKMRKELDLSGMDAKMIITQLENQIASLNLERRQFENELNIARENNQNLQLRIQDLDCQYKKLLESLEDWESKGKELNRLYEEESSHRKEIESELRAAHLDLHEMREAFNETKSGLSERMEDIRSLSDQNESLREEMTKEKNRIALLQKELEEMRAERSLAEETRFDLINSLKEQNEALRRDNRELNQIMLDALKSEKERYEREVKEHFKTKSELKEAENRLQGTKQSDSTAEAHIVMLESKLVSEEIERENLKQKLHLVEIEKQRLVKELQDIKKRFNEQSARFRDFKTEVQLLILGRFKIMRRELSDLKESTQTAIQECEEEFYNKFGSVVSFIKDHVLRKELQMSELLELERTKLNESYHDKISSIKDSFEHEQNHLAELLQKKLEAKEKEVLGLRNDILSLNLQNQRYDEDIEKLEQKVHDLETECRKKTQLIEQHDAEVRELKSRIESLQGRHERMVSRHEEQLRVSESAHKDEILKVRADYEGKVGKLDDDFEAMDKGKAEKIKQLQETISQLQKENNTIRVSYQTQLDRYETQLDELSFKMKLGGESSRSQQENEALNSQIKKLQEELAVRNERINALVNERNKAHDKIKELERRVDESDKFGLMLSNVENSSQNISRSFKNSGIGIDLKTNESEFSEYDSQLSRSVQGLKKIEKYLESRRSPSKRGSVRSPLKEFKFNEHFEDQEEKNKAKPRRL